MLRRFFLGLTEGLVIGLCCAVGSARGLELTTPRPITAAALAAAVGFFVGLVAGRPVWARDAKTEALLKAFLGALVGAGLSWALGHWLAAPVDLSQFALGAGPVGKLLGVSLPAIACALSLFFELDDTTSGALPVRSAAENAPKRYIAPADDAADLTELSESSDDSRSKLEKR